MGICWSDPPVQPTRPHFPRENEAIAQKTGSLLGRQPVYIVDKVSPAPSAPPYYPPQPQLQQPQYTYAVPYQQQQQLYATPYQQQQQQQLYAYYQTRPQPQQQQMGVGTAMLGGFVIGAMVDDILDPTE